MLQPYKYKIFSNRTNRNTILGPTFVGPALILDDRLLPWFIPTSTRELFAFLLNRDNKAVECVPNRLKNPGSDSWLA